MKISDLQTTLNLAALQGEYENLDLLGAYTSDLLSDVMANAPAQSVLITIQAHKNTVAVATLADIKAIVLCNGRTPEDEMVTAAKAEGIAIFSTKENQFKTSCQIGALL